MWLVAQPIGLLGFSVMAYSTVLGQLGVRLTVASSLWVGLVLLVAPVTRWDGARIFCQRASASVW